MMTDYQFPWEYNFPPFFTIQINQDTRRAQLDAWRALVCNYCNHNNIFQLDIRSALNHQLFQNKAINRSLTKESLNVILEDLREHGNLEWIDKDHTEFYIHWKSPSQWAQLLYAHANKKSLTNTVCTFYELTGDDPSGEFYGLDENVLKKAIQILEKQGKAALISFDGNEGVKFL